MYYFFVLPVIALVLGLCGTFDMVKTKTKETAVAFCVLFLLASAAQAQSVSPLVVECGKKCSGSFTVSNLGVLPMAVVVEPYSFRLGPGSETILRPLDKTVELELAETSTRIGPHSDHTFDYTMRCNAYPCLVALTTGMVVGHTAEGIAIRVVIPHIIYNCSTAKNCRKDSRLAAGLAK